jgi:hypothetical protein
VFDGFDLDSFADMIGVIAENLLAQWGDQPLNPLRARLLDLARQAPPYSSLTFADLLLRLTFADFVPPSPPDKVTLDMLNADQIWVLTEIAETDVMWVFPIRAAEILRVYRLPARRAALREFLDL